MRRLRRRRFARDAVHQPREYWILLHYSPRKTVCRSREQLIEKARELGFEHIRNERGSRYMGQHLVGQPVFKGLVGPMGDERIIIYETGKVYSVNSGD
jgi:hypothetical protein